MGPRSRRWEPSSGIAWCLMRPTPPRMPRAYQRHVLAGGLAGSSCWGTAAAECAAPSHAPPTPAALPAPCSVGHTKACVALQAQRRWLCTGAGRAAAGSGWRSGWADSTACALPHCTSHARLLPCPCRHTHQHGRGRPVRPVLRAGHGALRCAALRCAVLRRACTGLLRPHARVSASVDLCPCAPAPIQAPMSTKTFFDYHVKSMYGAWGWHALLALQAGLLNQPALAASPGPPPGFRRPLCRSVCFRVCLPAGLNVYVNAGSNVLVYTLVRPGLCNESAGALALSVRVLPLRAWPSLPPLTTRLPTPPRPACRASAWCGTPSSRCWAARRCCSCRPSTRRRWRWCSRRRSRRCTTRWAALRCSVLCSRPVQPCAMHTRPAPLARPAAAAGARGVQGAMAAVPGPG